MIIWISNFIHILYKRLNNGTDGIVTRPFTVSKDSFCMEKPNLLTTYFVAHCKTNLSCWGGRQFWLHTKSWHNFFHLLMFSPYLYITRNRVPLLEFHCQFIIAIISSFSWYMLLCISLQNMKEPNSKNHMEIDDMCTGFHCPQCTAVNEVNIDV